MKANSIIKSKNQEIKNSENLNFITKKYQIQISTN